MRLPLYFRLLPLYSFSLFIVCNEYEKTIFSFLLCHVCGLTATPLIQLFALVAVAMSWRVVVWPDPLTVSPRPSFVRFQ